MVFRMWCSANLVPSLRLSVLGKCHGLLQEDEKQKQTLDSTRYKVILALGSSRPELLKYIFQNVLEHISKNG